MQSLLLGASFGHNDRGIIIFGFEIYYYAICIVSAMIVAACLSALLMKRRNMAPDFIFTLFLFCIPTAIIGARLFSCLTEEGLGIAKFFQFRSGGLSITGGVIGGVTAGLIVCLVKKVNFFRAADCVVINILFAQAMGRWGNYFNQEVYGGLITDPSQQWFPWAVYIESDGGWHHAFFFYEMVLNLIGWALLFTFTWFRKKKPNGIPTFLYFVWYGTVRALMEPLRDPVYILDRGGVMWSELFAILMVGFGICGCLILMILNFRKEGKFIGSAKGDPCGITKYIPSSKTDVPYFSKINMFGANYPPKPPKEKKKKGTKEETPQETDGKTPDGPDDTDNTDDTDGKDGGQ